MSSVSIATFKLTGPQALFVKFLLFCLVCLFILISGFAASKGEVLYVLAILPIVVGIIISFSFKALLLVTLLGGLVISGLTQLYVPRLELIRWAFSASATLLLLHIALQALKSKTPRLTIDSTIIFWSLIFIFVLIASGILQNVGLSANLTSLKGYLQIWGVLFALALLPWKPQDMDKFPAFILLLSLIQIPFVLHQYLILVPMRSAITNVAGLVPIDIVSGTFGGKMDHGAANAALTIMCFITGSGLASLWNNKQIATRIFIPLMVLVMFPVFLNSTKISIFYLFIGVFVLFSDEFISNPFKFLSRLAITLLLCLLVAISVIKTMPESSDVASLADLYEQTYNYNFAQDNIRDNNLSRSGTINAWKDPVKPHGIKQLIIGYGIGSSRLIESDAARRISSTINLEEATGVTALAAILWETGVIGIITICMLFLSAYNVARKLKYVYKDNPFRKSIFTAAQCSVIIMFVSLGHKNFFVYHIGFQTMFVGLFGYLAYWERRAHQEILTNKNKQPSLERDYDYYD